MLNSYICIKNPFVDFDDIVIDCSKKYFDIPDTVLYRGKHWKLIRKVTFSGKISYHFFIFNKEKEVCLSAKRIMDLCSSDNENKDFESFVESHYNDLKNLEKFSVDYFLECYYLHMTKSNDRKKFVSFFKYGRESFSSMCIIFILFICGGIVAYIFQHLLALFYAWAAYIIWCLINVISCVFGILFNSDVNINDFDLTKYLLTPLQIWQIGGWISGTILFIAVIYELCKWLDQVPITLEEKNKQTKHKECQIIKKPINIDDDTTFKNIGCGGTLFLHINGVPRMAMSNFALKQECEKWVYNNFGKDYGFDDFCNYFSTELSVYEPWSTKWKLVCQKICSEYIALNMC